MTNHVGQINAMLPESAPRVSVGDRPEITQIRLTAHLIGQVAELTRAVAVLQAERCSRCTEPRDGEPP